MPASDRLQIRLLGDLTLLREGAGLALPPSRRTRALLGYLIAAGGTHSRAGLCDLLWDGPDDPRASLRWSLAKLRPVVDAPPMQRLVADRERVQFDPKDCEIDIEAVRRLVGNGVAGASLADLEHAATLLRGEFLDGLELPGCYRFHNWCMALRAQYGKTRREVLGALLQHLAGEPERALSYARALVAADPLAETAHAALVRLTAAAGRYPDAERHYEWARDLLRREVALPAGGALDEAIRRARREQQSKSTSLPPAIDAPQSPQRSPADSAAAPAQTHGAAVGATASDAPGLLGRRAEQQLIVQALGGGAGVQLLVFTGEPGIGKTRVLDLFAGLASDAGRRVLRGRCFEAEMARPYGPWLDAFRDVCIDDAATAPVSDAAMWTDGRIAQDGDRERLYRAAVALLSALAASHGLVLLFDDLHWIDEASASLLHYVARTPGSGTSLLVGGAARAGELEDNPRAKRLLHSLEREGLLLRQSLAPLGAADALRLLGATGLDAELALRQSGGNPLYLLELARAARRGATAQGGGIDRLIEDRLYSLDETARELLGWASAMGGPVRPDLLARAAGLPAADVLSRLQRFEHHALLRSAAAQGLTFAHDLVRQTVYRGLSQPRREAIHRQFARVFEQAGEDDPALHAERVHHALLANDALAAARACLASGQYCLRVFANGDAATTADRGLDSVAGLVPGPEKTRLEIALLGVRVAAAAGAGGRRLPALSERIDQAIEAAEALGLHADAGEAWQLHAFLQQQASDTTRTHLSTLAAERLTRRADAATHCRQLANSGRCLLDIEADPVRGRALLAEAVELAAKLDLQLMEIEWGRGLIERAEGRLDAAIAALVRAVALARLTGVHWREVECLTWLATVELEAGSLADVRRHVGEIVQAARRMGDSPTPFAHALDAIARWREHDGAAQAALEAHLQQLRELDDKARLAYALNEAAGLSLAAGRRDAAAAWANEALTNARTVRRPTEIGVSLALLARCAPDRAAALGWLAQLPGGPISARAQAAIATASGSIPTTVPTVAS
ncbi:MAG: AAA family ATPase [Lautropia sp.]